MIENSDWNFFSIKDIETRFTTFRNIVLSAMRIHAQLRKVYIRNDKPLFSLAQNFVSAKTRQLQTKKEKLLYNEIFDKLLNTRNQLNSNYKRDFEKFQRQWI